jgi:hypothetical protein
MSVLYLEINSMTTVFRIHVSYLACFAGKLLGLRAKVIMFEEGGIIFIGEIAVVHRVLPDHLLLPEHHVS